MIIFRNLTTLRTTTDNAVVRRWLKEGYPVVGEVV
jgi:hypothetical protein